MVQPSAFAALVPAYPAWFRIWACWPAYPWVPVPLRTSMTAPWSGSEVAAGEDELGEGVGSAEGVASTVGAALGLADALGVVAATVGVVVAGVVVCWRDRAVAAAHPRAGTITRMARKGHTFFHLDGLGRCMPTGVSSPARSNSSLGY